MSDESLLFLSSTLQQFATCSVVKWLWPPIFTCSGLGYLPLCIHSFFLRLTSVSQLSTFLLRFITPTASLATLLYAIQHFACSLSKFTNHFACYLCLNQRRSRFYDFVFASSIQSTHSEMDFNELYFSLFDLVHTHILPLLSSSLAPLCACEASIIHHSASFVSFSINRLSPSLLRPLRHTPDMTETNQVIRNSWLFLNAPKLRDFLQNTLLANSCLLVHAASSLLLFVYALVAADVLLVSMYDDANATTLQFNVFLSLIQLVNAMENSFKQCKSEAEYRQRVVSYQPTLNAITTLLGEVSINLLQYPTLKPLMSLLVIQLMKWVVSNDNNVLYDLAIHQLIKIARYSVTVCKKQLYSVLPDCIVGELAKSLLTVSTQRQDSIIHSVRFLPSVVDLHPARVHQPAGRGVHRAAHASDLPGAVGVHLAGDAVSGRSVRVQCVRVPAEAHERGQHEGVGVVLLPPVVVHGRGDRERGDRVSAVVEAEFVGDGEASGTLRVVAPLIRLHE